MNIIQQKLLIEQTDRKLSKFKQLEKVAPPPKGWVNSIRTALNMTLRQLGNRLKISAQSVKEIEEREVRGSVTLKSLQEVANALEMKLVYGFIPKDDSIEQLIEKRANDIARQIVMRASNTMTLEDQKNSNKRIKNAIKNKAEEIKNNISKYLWD